MNESILKSEEKAIFDLRSLYKSYGYLPFKMSKFEEYDLYVRNKDFLISDGVITFNDTNGKLLALKPDVTLSIVKNATDEPGCKQKYCYDENVYRISGSTHQYKELMQAGLECIGDIDLYDILEVISLAAESLSLLSDDFILAISHSGILSSILDAEAIDGATRAEIISCFAERNEHELLALCERISLSQTLTDCLAGLIGIYDAPERAIERISSLCGVTDGAIGQLGKLVSLLSGSRYASRLRIDTSLVSTSDYYGGFIFKGFLSGACESVLNGGQYGKLLRRMGRRSDAIGFAIYLDRLELLEKSSSEYDVDVLLLYSDDTDISVVASKAAELTSQGKSVSAQKAIPSKLRPGAIIDLKGECAK